MSVNNQRMVVGGGRQRYCLMMPKLFEWMIRNEWVQSLANEIVKGWIKFCKYEMKLDLSKIWKSKSFELDNEGGSEIIGTLQVWSEVWK